MALCHWHSKYLLWPALASLGVLRLVDWRLDSSCALGLDSSLVLARWVKGTAALAQQVPQMTCTGFQGCTAMF
jgi:hypothetical protein